MRFIGRVMRRRRWSVWALAVGLVVASAPHANTAPARDPQVVRLSEDLAPRERVGTFRVSPDGRWVLYGIVNDARPDLSRSIVRSIDGSTSRHVSGFGEFTPDSRTLITVLVRDDGTRVTVAVDLATGTVTELYDDQGPDLPGSENCRSRFITADSSHVVYIGLGSPGHGPVKSVPIAGGPVVRLSSRNTIRLAVSPDSEHAVFWDGALMVAPVEGGDERAITPVLEGFPKHLVVSPDSAQVLYLEEERPGRRRGRYRPNRLMSVPIEGGEPVRLSVHVHRGDDVCPKPSQQWLITPDSQRVVFVRQDKSVHPPSSSLFSTLTGGGDRVLLAGPFETWSDQFTIEVTPDSRLVVFAVGGRLYVVPPDGGAVVELSDESDRRMSIARQWCVDRSCGAVTPDGRHVIVRSDLDGDGVEERYAISLEGAHERVLVSAVAGDRNGFVTNDSQWVVFTREDEGVRRLFAAAIAGGLEAEIGGPMVAGGNVEWFDPRTRMLATGGRVVYRADARADGQWELFMTSLPVACDGGLATITGTQRAETLVGTRGRDVIAGLGGADTIVGLGGDDALCGGDGDDRIVAGRGHDVVLGGAGRDVIIGGPGDDHLDGGDDRDTLLGNHGDDVCVVEGQLDAWKSCRPVARSP